MRLNQQRWLVVAALFTITFGVANPFAAFGVFLPVLAEEFGWSRGAISVALSINFLLGGVAGFLVGTVADRYGPRAILLVTVVLAGTGVALASMVHALWQFYLTIGVMGGIGMSAFYLLSASTVARWFDRQRGLAIGVVLTGFNLGFVVGGPAAAWLIAHVGWRTAYVVLGAGCSLVGVLAALLVRDPSSNARPGTVTPSPSTLPSGLSGMTLRQALRDRRMWYLNVSWLLLGLILTMLSVHIVPFARDQGIDLGTAALALTAYGLSAAAGRLVFGAGSDRLGTSITMQVSFALQIVALIALLVAPSAAFLPLIMAVYGFGFAGSDTVFVRVIPDMFGLRALGAIMGVLALGWRCGAALGPSLTGFMYDLTGSYALPFGTAPVATLISYGLFRLAFTGRRTRGSS
jgi:MFS transporter, OFA family, oxalate/formate antiporter